MTTLNMDLDLPVVSTTPGPTYATLINQAFEAVDEHDHTSGKGVQVPSSGLNINAALTFNEYAATDVAYIELVAQGSAPALTRTFYIDGVSDLYYKNASGTSVQITNGGVLAAAGTGVITSAYVSSYPYSVTTGDAQKVLLINTSAARTLNLPAASNTMAFWVKDWAGTAGTYNITVAPNGSDTIDGVAANLTMNEDFSARMLVSDGLAGWWVL